MRVVLLLLLVALPGCSLPAPSAPPATGACGLQEHPAQDAPLLPAFREAPLDAARRLAAAVGDPLNSDQPELVEGDHWMRWATQHGTITWERDDSPDGVRLLWDAKGDARPAGPEEANATLERALRAFGAEGLDLQRGFEGSGASFRVTAQHRFREGWLERERAEWSVGPASELLLGSFHAVPDERVVDEATARAAARAYARCTLDAQGQTSAAGYPAMDDAPPLSWRAWNGTLARVVSVPFASPEPGHCGDVVDVLVAARTGEPFGVAPTYCD